MIKHRYTYIHESKVSWSNIVLFILKVKFNVQIYWSYSKWSVLILIISKARLDGHTLFYLFQDKVKWYFKILF
jgi:hypothetical protein